MQGNLVYRKRYYDVRYKGILVYEKDNHGLIHGLEYTMLIIRLFFLITWHNDGICQKTKMVVGKH